MQTVLELRQERVMKLLETWKQIKYECGQGRELCGWRVWKVPAVGRFRALHAVRESRRATAGDLEVKRLLERWRKEEEGLSCKRSRDDDQRQ